MSVVVETTLGDITIDLFIKERPKACINFLKLCKVKYYNYNLFHTISRGFIAQTGDPTGSRNGGESIYGVLEGPLKRYFEAETQPRIKHTTTGLVSFVGTEGNMIGSQFFITLATELSYLDGVHCVFGEVVEGLDVVELLNDAICDVGNRPYQDIRITHTVVLDDPFPDPPSLRVPERSPSPSAERLQGGRIAPDEEIDEATGKDLREIEEMKAEREAKARATILEMVGDIPDAEMAPPENVLFVCKLNPVTTDDDLEIIFSRFGKINSCEVIRDKKSGDSLQYAFIEFNEKKSCEDAYFKMDNVLIDDRRIHVDFSQSVAKIKWHGKGRGVTHYDERGKKTTDSKNNLGKGLYSTQKQKEANGNSNNKGKPQRVAKSRSRSRSPSKNKSRRERTRSRSPRDNYRPYTNQSRDRGYRERGRRPPYVQYRNKQEYKPAPWSNRNRPPYYSNRSRSPQYTRYYDKPSQKSRTRSRSRSRDRSTYSNPSRDAEYSREKTKESSTSRQATSSSDRVKTESKKYPEKSSSSKARKPSSSSDSSSSEEEAKNKKSKSKKSKRKSTSSSSSSEEENVKKKATKKKCKKRRKRSSSEASSSSDSEEKSSKKKNKKR